MEKMERMGEREEIRAFLQAISGPAVGFRVHLCDELAIFIPFFPPYIVVLALEEYTITLHHLSRNCHVELQQHREERR